MVSGFLFLENRTNLMRKWVISQQIPQSQSTASPYVIRFSPPGMKPHCAFVGIRTCFGFWQSEWFVLNDQSLTYQYRADCLQDWPLPSAHSQSSVPGTRLRKADSIFCLLPNHTEQFASTILQKGSGYAPEPFRLGMLHAVPCFFPSDAVICRSRTQYPQTSSAMAPTHAMISAR